MSCEKQQLLACYPKAIRISVFESTEYGLRARYIVTGFPGVWHVGGVGRGVQVNCGGKRAWMNRDTTLEAVILKLAKEIEEA